MELIQVTRSKWESKSLPQTTLKSPRNWFENHWNYCFLGPPLQPWHLEVLHTHSSLSTHQPSVHPETSHLISLGFYSEVVVRQPSWGSPR